MTVAEQAPAPRRRLSAAWLFWGVALLLAAMAVVLAVAGKPGGPPVHAPQVQTAELPPTLLGRMIRDAAAAAVDEQEDRIDALLDAAFAPAYQAVPAYAGFHYSVLGQYAELADAALGQMTERLEERLFAGLSARLNQAAQELDRGYASDFARRLDDAIAQELPGAGGGVELGEASAAIRRDALQRMSVSVPVASTLALTGTAGVRAAAAALSRRIAGNIAAKAAARGAAKNMGSGSAAASGALVCSPGGPIASGACALGAAAAIWLATDAVAVRIDEYFNREDFEADLRRMIDETREQTRMELLAALARKQGAAGDFTFRESHGGG